MNNESAVFNDQGRAFAKRRADGILVLAHVKKLGGPLRRTIWKFLGRPLALPSTPSRSPLDALRRQLKSKNARQLIKLRRREMVELAVERRRYAISLPKIIEGVLPSNLPAVRFLESRLREIEKEMTCRGVVAAT